MSLKVFSKEAVSVFIGTTLAALTGVPLVPLAWMSRGCSAVGGEWLMILGAGVFGYWITHYILQ